MYCLRPFWRNIAVLVDDDGRNTQRAQPIMTLEFVLLTLGSFFKLFVMSSQFDTTEVLYSSRVEGKVHSLR